MYAFSDVAPTSNVPSTFLTFHKGGFGSFETDFKQAVQTVWLTKQRAIWIHGSVMWTAWILAPLCGVFTARFLKARLGLKWYYIHQSFMGGVLAVGSIVGVTMVYLVKAGNQFEGATVVQDVHYKLGLALVIVVWIQVLLGYASNRYFDKERKYVDTTHTVHRWFGRLLLLSAFVNVYLGMVVMQGLIGLSDVFVALHFVIVTVGIAVFVGAEWKGVGKTVVIGDVEVLNEEETERLVAES